MLIIHRKIKCSTRCCTHSLCFHALFWCSESQYPSFSGGFFPPLNLQPQLFIRGKTSLLNIQRSGFATFTALSQLFKLFTVDTQVTKPQLCVVFFMVENGNCRTTSCQDFSWSLYMANKWVQTHCMHGIQAHLTITILIV